MNRVYVPTANRWLPLTDLLGRGGEGQVRATDDPAWAVKVFHPDARAGKAAKVEQMTHRPLPAGLFAAPEAVALDAPGGECVGYVMSRVTGIKLFSVYNPAARRRAGLKWDLVFAVEAAAGLAGLVAAAHAAGYRIPDQNESNFLVAVDAGGRPLRPARVVAIDCDSYQFTGRDPKTGAPAVFRCGVGKDPYLPPELLDADLAAVDRTPSHDSYATGTLVWQLLKGDLPHSVLDPAGRPAPDPQTLVRAGQWPYRPAVPLRTGLQPTDAGLPYRCLPADLRALFERCFRDGFTDPARRPTAAEWQGVLERWLAAERRKLPTTWRAAWRFVRGRLGWADLTRAIERAARGAEAGAAWDWLAQDRRWAKALAGVVCVGVCGLALFRSPAARDAATADPTRPPDPAAVDRRVREAEDRWRGAPAVFREALRERLEEGP
jgi:DNA-binding helix-hairpin-helix protein with protein kinase domain